MKRIGNVLLSLVRYNKVNIKRPVDRTKKKLEDHTLRDHSFKMSACVRGGGVSPCADGPKVQRSQYIRIKNPLHKHFAGMPMVGG